MDESWYSTLEWVAAALGLVNIALLVRRSIWNYAFGMAMVAIYVFVFLEKRLYAESGLQVFFFAAQGWGWWLWAKSRRAPSKGERDEVPVGWLSPFSRIVWALVTAALSLNLGWALARFTNAAMPFADSAVTGASVAAQILLGLRRTENWVLWIAIDVASVALYINRELYPTAALYVGFLVLSVLGLREWMKAQRA